MKRVIAFLITLILINGKSAFATTSVYVVQTGDTLPQLAVTFETTVEDLKLTNGLTSDELIVGQELRIPVMHEVQPTDTLADLAELYHSSVALIKTTNHLPSDTLIPGEVLRIIPRSYTIQNGHLLMTIEEFQDWLERQKFRRDIKLIQQHHTWIPSYNRFNGQNHFRLLAGMERYHKEKMHWQTIAQNITTFPDGKIAISRNFNLAPEGSIGAIANAHGIAIEHLGNFDLGADVMTPEQKDTIIMVNALLCLKFGLTPSIDTITYHH